MTTQPKGPRILIVDDEPNIRELLSTSLRFAGFGVRSVGNGAQTISAVLEEEPDLIILDVMLPDMNGFSVTKRLRSAGYTAPILFLTAKDDVGDKVQGLTVGGDDYVTKPYNPTILLLRISAVLKRSAAKPENNTYNGLELNTAKGILGNGEKEVSLTKNELLIFQQLLDRKGEIVTRDDLMTVLWDNEEYINDNALTVNISRLRAKLADIGCENAIETRKKQGYVLV